MGGAPRCGFFQNLVSVGYTRLDESMASFNRLDGRKKILVVDSTSAMSILLGLDAGPGGKCSFSLGKVQPSCNVRTELQRHASVLHSLSRSALVRADQG